MRPRGRVPARRARRGLPGWVPAALVGALAVTLLPPGTRAEAPAASCTAPDPEQNGDDGGRAAPPAAPSCAEASREGAVAVAFPWTAPHFALETPLSRAFQYGPYPYADGALGVLRVGEPVPHLRNPRDAFVAGCSDTEAARDAPCLPRRLGRQRGELEVGTAVLTERATGLGLAARLRTRVRLEPALELLATQGWGAPASDRTLFGHAGLDYRFAQSIRLHLRSGLGALTWSDAGGTRAGGFWDYAVEWFPRAPWTLEAHAAIGGLSGAFYGRLRLVAGVVWRRLELRLGYDHIALRGADVTRLSGPRLSVRVWL